MESLSSHLEEREKGPVEFDVPFGLAADKKGTLYVSDRGNDRIQIFTILIQIM